METPNEVPASTTRPARGAAQQVAELRLVAVEGDHLVREEAVQIVVERIPGPERALLHPLREVGVDLACLRVALRVQAIEQGLERLVAILRGPWGLQIDKAIVWTTGYSLVTAQYAWAQGDTYVPTLMLWTHGARTRRWRSACLPYFRVGDDLVVRGSNGGGPTDPHWVHNVRADGSAWVRVARRNRPVRAWVARGEERERIHEELCRQSRSTRMYQKMCAPWELPLVVLRDRDT